MKYVYIGKITSTHGLKGELKLKSSFLYIDRVLKEDFPFFIGDEKREVSLSKYRIHNSMYLLTFKGYEDINLVEDFRNKDLYVLKDNIQLKDNEYLFEDYIGLKAYYKNNFIGDIKSIVDCGNNNYVFVIGEDILIPMNKDFIEEVIVNDRVIFKEVEGLINAN